MPEKQLNYTSFKHYIRIDRFNSTTVYNYILLPHGIKQF
jgi:hypothetical protein